MTIIPSRIIYFVYGSFLVTLFSGGMIIPVFVLCSLYILWNCRHQFNRQLLYKPQILALSGFLFWASISYFWSISADISLETIIKFWAITLLGLSAMACLVTDGTNKFKSINANLLLSILAMISLILILEHISAYKLALFFRRLLDYEILNYGQPMDHATALYSLLLPFCFYYLANNRTRLYILFILSAVVYILHPMFAALLAVLLGVLAAIIVNKTGSRGVKILSILSVLMIFFMPQIMSFIINMDYFQVAYAMPSSWQERIDIWTKSVELINARPVLGWGLDTASELEAFISQSSISVIQAHPHNISLQIRLESGLPGIALFSVFVGYLWRKIHQQTDRAYAMACVASLIIYLCFATVSFNAWHSWWLCTQYLAVIAMLCFKKLGLQNNETEVL